MLEYWIWLAQTSDLPEKEKVALVKQSQSPEDIYFARRKSQTEDDLSDARKILEDCRHLEIQIVTFSDADYPFRLRHIPDPPMVLYYKGKLPDFQNDPAIGIVGTRKASTYGLQTARQLGYQIGKCGAVVVTGMAYGIDAMAASGTLMAGQCVVGVLGCGVDIVYPKSNKHLFCQMESFGCLISEFAPGTPPFRQNFPRRNRIISGLSDGVLVVEAPEGSGALITARRALEQGRDVFAVPGNIDQPGFAGSNQLLKEGATLAASGWDVLCEYQNRYPDKLHKEEIPASFSEEKPLDKVAQKVKIPGDLSRLKEKLEKKPIDKNPSTAYSDVNAIAQTLKGTDKAVVLALASGPLTLEALIAATGVASGKLLPSLTLLEIRGIVKRLPGKRISLK